ncbi:unnamed protein product [marine sediment metagenome]|uniref:Uncharacterized protein n=1 Tax=marine sediment metagenome TaxID=412755 RepID=X1CRF6_9ZZZZ
MAFEKRAILSFNKIKPLNNPNGWEIFNLPNQIKIASAQVALDEEDLGGFDLKTATQEYPEFLYLKIFAIKKDEPNDNGDAFSFSSLVASGL